VKDETEIDLIFASVAMATLCLFRSLTRSINEELTKSWEGVRIALLIVQLFLSETFFCVLNAAMAVEEINDSPTPFSLNWRLLFPWNYQL